MKVKITSFTTSVFLHIYLGISVAMAIIITKRKKSIKSIKLPYNSQQSYAD